MDNSAIITEIQPPAENEHRLARFSLSLELIERLLCFPKGTKVHALLPSQSRPGLDVDLIIEHSSLSPVYRGDYMPTLRPFMRWNEVQLESGERQIIITIPDWGYGNSEAKGGQ